MNVFEIIKKIKAETKVIVSVYFIADQDEFFCQKSFFIRIAHQNYYHQIELSEEQFDDINNIIDHAIKIFNTGVEDYYVKKRQQKKGPNSVKKPEPNNNKKPEKSVKKQDKQEKAVKNDYEKRD